MHLTRRSLQRGEGNIGCIFWSLALAVAVMIAWKMVPIKVATAEFHDFMDDQARIAGNVRSAEPIRKAILLKARELDIPVDPKDLVINLDRERIKMQVQYTIPVEFPGFTYDWEFEYAERFNIYIF